MAGHGRPRVEDLRDKQYRLRLNNEETSKLNQICKDFGMNKSDTVRKLIEDYEKNKK